MKPTALKEYELHIEAGLVDGGKDAEGEQLWIGTRKQWEKFEEVEEEYKEHQLNEEEEWGGSWADRI